MITLYKKGSNDLGSVYLRILYHFYASRDEEVEDAIKEFLSIIDNECRQWSDRPVL